MRAGVTVAAGDMAAYQAHKRALLGGVSGTVLEIGAGYGANFPYFPAGIDWIGLEPDPSRRRHLTRVAAGYGHHEPVIAAPAEHIPLDNGSVDTVVATAVLCSVDDQDRVLAEVNRVLRPAGALIFFEHVAAPAGSWSRRLQGWWAPFSRRLDSGCDPTRATWRVIESAGFRHVRATWYTRGSAVGIYQPFLGGIAYA